MRVAVVVTGLPGSGKTTLAVELALLTGMTHLDKDAILEDMFTAHPVHSEHDRNALSRAADRELAARALAHDQVVLSSWWRHPLASGDSGTPIQWIHEHALRVVEVYCSCPVEIALQRFLRRVRHPSHLDALRSPALLQEQFKQAAERGPMLPGAVICDTSGSAPLQNVAVLANQITHLLGRHED